MSICETIFSAFPYSLTTEARIGCKREDFDRKDCEQVEQEVGAEVVFRCRQWVNNKDVGLIIVRHVEPEVPAMYRNNTLQYSGPSQQRLHYLIRPQMFATYLLLPLTKGHLSNVVPNSWQIGWLYQRGISVYIFIICMYVLFLKNTEYEIQVIGHINIQ